MTGREIASDRSADVLVVGAGAAGVEDLGGSDVVLSDGSRIQPEAVIAATGYRRGLESLVGHLGVLGQDGTPEYIGERTHPRAPGFYFVGYANPLSGQLRGIRLDANGVARAIARAARDRDYVGLM